MVYHYHLKAIDLHIPKIASTITNEVVALAKDDLKKNKQTNKERKSQNKKDSKSLGIYIRYTLQIISYFKALDD